MRLKLKQFFRANKYFVGAFLLPASIMLAGYAILLVYPFGFRSALVLDGSAQYVYYFEALREAVLGDQSLLYSWSRALGGEMLGIYNYYLASPLSFLILLFPREWITEAVLILTLLKTGLCGLTFAVYLKRSRRAEDNCLMVLFPTLYALSSFVVVQATNIMWLDGVFLLPLIILGVERIIEQKKYMLFIIALTLTFTANYYIAYMSGIFSFLYFLCYYFQDRDRLSWKAFIKTSAVFFGSAFVAALCAGLTIFGTLYSLYLGKLEFTNPSMIPASQFDLLDFLAKMLPISYDTVRREGLPVVYSGALTAFLLPLYFLNEDIGLRKKVSSAAILGLVFISMNISTIDIMWHGFQVPNWIPYRYSFAFSFVAVVLAYEAFAAIRRVPFRTAALVYTGIIGLIFVISKQGYSFVSPETTTWVSLAVFTGYLTIIYYWIQSAGARRLTAALTVFLTLELLANTALTFYAEHADLVYSNRQEYRDIIDQTLPVVNQIKERDDSFYRLEKTFMRRVNDAMALSTAGFSHSSSAPNKNALAFFRDFGFSGDTFKTTYMASVITQDSLVGIKYVLSKETEPEFMTLVSPAGDEIKAYENPYALPIGFLSSADIIGYRVSGKRNPFEAQNDFFSDLLGEKTNIFTQLEIKDTGMTNLIQSQEAGQKKYTKGGSSQSPNLEYTVYGDGDHTMYMWISAYNLGKVSVSADGRDVGEYFGEPSYILPLGRPGADGKLTVKLQPREQDFYVTNACFAALDLDAFEKAVSDLREGGFKITKWSQTKLSGTVDAENSGVFFTTIPYEPGWKAEVDGVKVETYLAANAFLAFDIPAGTHTVKLEFMPEEVIFGSIVSVCGLIVLIFLLIRNIRKSRRIFLPLTPAEDEDNREDGLTADDEPAVAENVQTEPEEDGS